MCYARADPILPFILLLYNFYTNASIEGRGGGGGGGRRKCVVCSLKVLDSYVDVGFSQWCNVCLICCSMASRWYLVECAWLILPRWIWCASFAWRSHSFLYATYFCSRVLRGALHNYASSCAREFERCRYICVVSWSSFSIFCVQCCRLCWCLIWFLFSHSTYAVSHKNYIKCVI